MIANKNLHLFLSLSIRNDVEFNKSEYACEKSKHIVEEDRGS